MKETGDRGVEMGRKDWALFAGTQTRKWEQQLPSGQKAKLEIERLGVTSKWGKGDRLIDCYNASHDRWTSTTARKEMSRNDRLIKAIKCQKYFGKYFILFFIFRESHTLETFTTAEPSSAWYTHDCRGNTHITDACTLQVWIVKSKWKHIKKCF